LARRVGGVVERRDPGRVLALADDLHAKPHERVVEPAQLGALTEVLPVFWAMIVNSFFTRAVRNERS